MDTAQKADLEDARKHNNVAKAKVRREQIVRLLRDEGLAPRRVAERLGCGRDLVTKVRREEGIAPFRRGQGEP